jgi:hypothetical protein
MTCGWKSLLEERIYLPIVAQENHDPRAVLDGKKAFTKEYPQLDLRDSSAGRVVLRV